MHADERPQQREGRSPFEQDPAQPVLFNESDHFKNASRF
jgi:hypothetical protein